MKGKRGREGGDGDLGGRERKRQTPDRRLKEKKGGRRVLVVVLLEGRQRGRRGERGAGRLQMILLSARRWRRGRRSSGRLCLREFRCLQACMGI